MSNHFVARRLLVAVVVFGGLTPACGKNQTTPTPPPPPPPAQLAVTGMFPSSGSTFGVMTATITGTGFQTGASVTLDGAAVKATVLLPTSISVVVPAHAAGRVSVVVTNPMGESADVSGGYTYVVSPLRAFTDPATGFSTSDLRDAQEQIVQLNSDGYLIFTPESVAFPGHSVGGGSSGEIYIEPLQASCACYLEVRFGTRDGERRAYLTGEAIHDNPGTLVDLELVSGALVVSRTNVYPPGTYALSGVVTEMTATGPVPLEGVGVYFLVSGGWRWASTDSSGSYEIPGLYDLKSSLAMIKDGYDSLKVIVTVTGNTRFDGQLVRR